jgi:quinolinate synthase
MSEPNHNHPLEPSGETAVQSPNRLSRLQEKILELKKEKRAVILAHNYQIKEIQEVADYVGDSLGLSYQAAQTDADVICFCGVHFMAETAKIINPSKKVILPDAAAGCSLSDSCPADKLAAYKSKYPDDAVVAYINCSAEVKALADVICTSGNATTIVNRIPADKNILFVPDQNLGQWVSRITGRNLKLWPGSCYAHILFSREQIERLRLAHPGAKVVAHPECVDAVRNIADEVCSTEKMVRYCSESSAQTFIIVTETGMLHRLRRELPHKTFIAGPTEQCACNDCRFMKLNTLEKLHQCLESLSPEIQLPEALISEAIKPIQRMLDWSR